jgi:hypothetical protein
MFYYQGMWRRPNPAWSVGTVAGTLGPSTLAPETIAVIEAIFEQSYTKIPTKHPGLLASRDFPEYSRPAQFDFRAGESLDLSPGWIEDRWGQAFES